MTYEVLESTIQESSNIKMVRRTRPQEITKRYKRECQEKSKEQIKVQRYAEASNG